MKSFLAEHKMPIIWSVAVLLLAVLSILVIGRLKQAPRPEAEQSSIIPHVQGFTTYYPSTLPEGYSIDSKHVSYGNGVLFYRLTSNTGATVNVSEQAVPPTLSESTIIGKETLSTNYGTATLSFVEGKTIVNIITNDKQTMILVNTSDKVSTDTLKDIMRSFKPLTDEP